MNPRVKRWVGWVVGVLVVVGFFYGFMLLGEAFQTYRVHLAVWVAVPILACLLLRQNVSACFTLFGLRRVLAILGTIAVALSFLMFASFDDLRKRFGRHCVEGYRFWPAQTEDDVNVWTAKTRSGRWAVGFFEFLIFAGIFASPAITLKATRRAIHKK